MEKEITGKAIFNLFKMHYEDAEYFLSMANEHKKQNNRKMEWRYSRISILSYFFTLEALINFILYDMHSKKISSTPTLENLEKMRIYDKYLLVPLICENFSGEILDKNHLECLNRLSSLRNDYVHSKYVKRKRKKKGKPITETEVVAKIFRTPEGLQEVLAEIRPKEEKDDLTGLKRNIFSLDYEDALKSKEISDWVLEKMNNLLKGLLLGKKYLPSARESEILAERAGVFNPWIESDFFVDVSEEEYKGFDDYQLKGVIKELLEQKLSGEDKKIFDSFSAREKEEFTTILVKEFKKRRSYAEDKRSLQ